MTSVSEKVSAPAEAVWALVSDVPRMGEWSPECVRCEWVGGATGAAPGAKFKGHNRLGWRRWTTTGTVVTAEPGRELAFDVTSVMGLPVSRWTYRIEPDGDGCVVTESTEDRRGGFMKVLGVLATGVSDRADHNAESMRKTLARLKAAAEA